MLQAFKRASGFALGLLFGLAGCSEDGAPPSPFSGAAGLSAFAGAGAFGDLPRGTAGAASFGGLAGSGSGGSGDTGGGGRIADQEAGGSAGAPETSGGASGAGGLGGGAGAVHGSGGAGGASSLPNVTLFLIGDSTVAPYGAASAQQGWGEHLHEYLRPSVKVDDRAIGGRTVRSFMFDDAAETKPTAGWQSLKSAVHAGDYVMIEFGINDSSPGSERFLELTDFKRLLGSMVDQLQAAKATPLMVTPTALQEWTNGVEGNKRLGPYVTAMKEVAQSEGILVADLNARSVEYLNQIGQTAASELYINGDKAHFTLKGGTTMAGLLGKELVRVHTPLADYVTP